MARSLEVQIDGLALWAYHGVLAEETRLGQRFVLDLALEPLSDAACDSDALADAVDYGAVSLRALEIAGGGPYQLIERVAELVAAALIAEFPLRRATVRVRKPSAPVPAVLDGVAVVVTRTREG